MTRRPPPRSRKRQEGGHTGGVPTPEAVLRLINESPVPLTREEIEDIFGVDAQGKKALRHLLRQLRESGEITKEALSRKPAQRALPEVSVIELTEVDEDGHWLATPLDWMEAAPAPRIVLDEARQGLLELGKGTRLLARLRPGAPGEYLAKAIKRITEETRKLLGVVRHYSDGVMLLPTDRKDRNDYTIIDAEPPEEGTLVLAEVLPTRAAAANRQHHRRQTRQGLPVKIVESLGSAEDHRNFSLIAIFTHGLPNVFNPAAVELAERATIPPLSKRTDLRHLPLVTIDGEDARDFDDAVFAAPDEDPNNPEGWYLVVAIADVSHYVTPGDALDVGALERGNSTYFPDRVVPMLPENLSNNLCSLRPGEDRACVVAHMWINKRGKLLRHRFERSLMHSHARLTYNQVQHAIENDGEGIPADLFTRTITPLYGVYKALLRDREQRDTLELNLPEYKVLFDEHGEVLDIATRERYDAHKLIEECMIAANVAAAEFLHTHGAEGIYRVHEQPNNLKFAELKEFLGELGVTFSKQDEATGDVFNRILAQAQERPDAHLINMVVLRAQMQAYYHPQNLGHFGLGLTQYCHFTSPIRRYSDLIVHRALCNVIEGKKRVVCEGTLEEVSEHISATERRSMLAERETVDRFSAFFMRGQVGHIFEATITGVTNAGLFITLAGTNASGLVPIRSLGNDFYAINETRTMLMGRRTRTCYQLGDVVMAKLIECNPITGNLIFVFMEGNATERREGRDANPPTTSKYKMRRGSGGGKPGGAPSSGKKHKKEHTPGKKSRKKKR